MHFMQLVILILCAVIQMNNLCQADPCLNHQCGPNTVCRLQAVRCIRAPCPPIPVCDDSFVDRRKCGPGAGPVLNIRKVEIFCGRGPNRRICPDHTECKIDPLDRYAVCCWKGPILNIKPKPGRCPKTQPGPGICIARCSKDVDCPGRQKCCGSCPRECKPPVSRPILNIKPKPGRCPRPQPGPGICIARCSKDVDCPGRQKCCGSCPRECKPPVSIQHPGRCPWYYARRRCLPQTECVTDLDCRRNQKCCGTPCGRVCTTPTSTQVQRYPWWWWRMGYGSD